MSEHFGANVVKRYVDGENGDDGFDGASSSP